LQLKFKTPTYFQGLLVPVQQANTIGICVFSQITKANCCFCNEEYIIIHSYLQNCSFF